VTHRLKDARKQVVSDDEIREAVVCAMRPVTVKYVPTTTKAFGRVRHQSAVLAKMMLVKPKTLKAQLLYQLYLLEDLLVVHIEIYTRQIVV